MQLGLLLRASMERREQMSPRFSVVIPVYKVEKYLRQCLDSVLAQSYTDFEIVVVDDGSPDNCPAICDAYATSDSRVTVIHKENGGLSDARNAGLLAATGEYVIFMDSDDYYLSTDLFTEIDAKIAETACDAVFFQYRKYIEKSKTLKEIPTPYPATIECLVMKCCCDCHRGICWMPVHVKKPLVDHGFWKTACFSKRDSFQRTWSGFFAMCRS